MQAMPKLSGAAFNAIKAVVLTGDPFHKSGLSCNVDENGSTTTLSVDGISEYQGVSIPSGWVAKTKDICYKVSFDGTYPDPEADRKQGDGICDTKDGGLNFQHLMYGSTASVQNYGTNWIVAGLTQ